MGGLLTALEHRAVEDETVRQNRCPELIILGLAATDFQNIKPFRYCSWSFSTLSSALNIFDLT